jgi:hypothetical protein
MLTLQDRIRCSVSCLIGGILFIILTFFGMLFYPGGHQGDSNTIGYSFFNNYFSDLGRTVSYSGEQNIVSCILFILAMLTAAVSVFLYFHTIKSYFKQTKKLQLLMNVAYSCAIITAINFCLIAAVPTNIHLLLHRIFVLIAFTATFISTIIYMIMIILNPAYPNTSAYILLGYNIILVSYLVLLYSAIAIDSLSFYLIQTIAQKIVIYSQIVVFIVLAILSTNFLRHLPVKDPQPENGQQVLF